MYQKDGCCQKSQYKHYNGQKQTEGEGGVLRIWIFQAGKVPKKLENFSGIAHSVLMPLEHFELHFWLFQPQTHKTTVVW